MNTIGSMKANIHLYLKELKHIVKSSKKLSITFLRLQVYFTLKDLATKTSPNSDGSNRSYRCHLIILNKKEYVYLSQMCVNTFLKFHPNADFVLHVDPKLELLTRRKFKTLIQLGLVNIRICRGEVENWQRRKLEVILAMKEISEIFMDADLRWNGQLPPLEFFNVYLKEFSIRDHDLYLSNLPVLSSMQNASMYNLSFFCSNGNDFTEDEKAEILDLELQISNMKSDPSKETQIAPLRRMSEQLALSIFLDKSQRRVIPLKSEDARNDGAFVESCYFGSTGLSF